MADAPTTTTETKDEKMAQKLMKESKAQGVDVEKLQADEASLLSPAPDTKPEPAAPEKTEPVSPKPVEAKTEEKAETHQDGEDGVPTISPSPLDPATTTTQDETIQLDQIGIEEVARSLNSYFDKSQDYWVLKFSKKKFKLVILILIVLSVLTLLGYLVLMWFMHA